MTEPRAERYESSDAAARPLLLFGVALALIIAGAALVSAWLDRRFEREIAAETPASSLRELRRAAEGPVLQPVPGIELVQHRAWEQDLISGTGWIDPVNGVVRIPVERAMELTLAEGFPVRKEERR